MQFWELCLQFFKTALAVFWETVLAVFETALAVLKTALQFLKLRCSFLKNCVAVFWKTALQEKKLHCSFLQSGVSGHSGRPSSSSPNGGFHRSQHSTWMHHDQDRMELHGKERWLGFLVMLGLYLWWITSYRFGPQSSCWKASTRYLSPKQNHVTTYQWYANRMQPKLIIIHPY